MYTITKQFRYQLTFILLFLLLYHKVFGLITIEKVVTRPPKEQDIGLIFDITIVNSDCEKKEMLEYSIRSDGACSLNVSSTMCVNNMGRIVGGEFGFIEAGLADTVSLIWPTVSLFNRVGYCPIVIISSNAKNDEFHLKHTISFDTRFDTLDPECRFYKAQKDFNDCKNWDLEYFKNCTPVDCEERYFGLRSFFNETTQSCEAIPKCTSASTYYDRYANECIDVEHILTEQELEDLKCGKYDNNVLNLRPDVKRKKYPTETSVDESTSPEDTFANFFSRNFYKRNTVEEHKTSDAVNTWTNHLRIPFDVHKSSWLKGIGNGLLIVGVIILLQVFATITIYALICFAIFLVVTWLSNRPCTESDGTQHPLLQTPASSGTNVYTPPSVMSQR